MSTPLRGYKPHVPVRRPVGKPAAKPRYRVLPHRQYESAWQKWVVDKSGFQSAQQCWDHLAFTPNQVPKINSATKLRGKNFKAKNGYSDTLHYRVSKDVRVDYRYQNSYVTGPGDVPHHIVRIDFVGQSKSGT